MSLYDTWLLMFGRETQNKWLLQNGTSIVFQQCENKVSLQKKVFSFVSKFLLNLLKG